MLQWFQRTPTLHKALDAAPYRGEIRRQPGAFYTEVINHHVLPWGEKQCGNASVVVAVEVAAAAVWFLLMLFFSFIHGYSGGRDAACSGLQPLGECFERLWRGWMPEFRPGTVCSKGGGISVDCESAELLIDEL